MWRRESEYFSWLVLRSGFERYITLMHSQQCNICHFPVIQTFSYVRICRGGHTYGRLDAPGVSVKHLHFHILARQEFGETIQIQGTKDGSGNVLYSRAQGCNDQRSWLISSCWGVRFGWGCPERLVSFIRGREYCGWQSTNKIQGMPINEFLSCLHPHSCCFLADQRSGHRSWSCISLPAAEHAA